MNYWGKVVDQSFWGYAPGACVSICHCETCQLGVSFLSVYQSFWCQIFRFGKVILPAEVTSFIVDMYLRQKLLRELRNYAIFNMKFSCSIICVLSDTFEDMTSTLRTKYKNSFSRSIWNGHKSIYIQNSFVIHSFSNNIRQNC